MSTKDKADIRGFFGKGPKDDPKPARKMVVLDSCDMVIVDSDSENDKANSGEAKLQGRSVKKRDWNSIPIAFANNSVIPFSRLLTRTGYERSLLRRAAVRHLRRRCQAPLLRPPREAALRTKTP
jgi:hypothetical protein